MEELASILKLSPKHYKDFVIACLLKICFMKIIMSLCIMMIILYVVASAIVVKNLATSYQYYQEFII